MEGIAGLIHPPHGAPARIRRNGECFELSQRGVIGRWKVIALCGEGASLSLQDVCLPHSQPTANSVPAHHCFSHHDGLCTFPNGPQGSLPPWLRTTGHSSNITEGSGCVLENAEESELGLRRLPAEQLYFYLFYITEILFEKIPTSKVFENRNAVVQLKSNIA